MEINTVNGEREATRSGSQQTQSLVAAFSEIYTERMFQPLLSAYSTVGIQDTALFLGMNEDDAASCKILILHSHLFFLL